MSCEEIYGVNNSIIEIDFERICMQRALKTKIIYASKGSCNKHNITFSNIMQLTHSTGIDSALKTNTYDTSKGSGNKHNILFSYIIQCSKFTVQVLIVHQTILLMQNL